MRTKFTGACFALLTAIGCGPSVKVAPEFTSQAPSLYAMLPIQAPEGTRPERVSYVSDVIESNLRNQNYFLLDNSVVQKVCTSPACSERQKLAQDYHVGAFIETKISTLSKNNFLLGYADVLDGEVRIVDPAGKELVKATHTQTNTGGLLFNSGQVIEGFRSSVKNYGDSGFNLLAQQFAERIASQLPRPSAADVDSVTITSVDAKAIQPLIFEVCANGTPKSIGVLSFGRARSSLREVSNGRYCGIYRLESGLISLVPPEVELRSAFGNIARQPVTLSLAKPCDYTGRVKLMAGEKKTQLLNESDCGGSISVYKAGDKFGPFRKIGEIKGTSWNDPELTKAVKSTPAIYQLVGMTTSGESTLAFTPVDPNAPSVAANK